MTNNKKYNLTLSPMYKAGKNDNFISIEITPAIFDALQNIEIGGKLFFKQTKQKKTDKSPDAYLEYISKDEVDRFKASKPEAQDSL